MENKEKITPLDVETLEQVSGGLRDPDVQATCPYCQKTFLLYKEQDYTFYNKHVKVCTLRSRP